MQDQIQQLDSNIQTIAGWVKTNAANISEYGGKMEEIESLLKKIRGATIINEQSRNAATDLADSSFWELGDTPDEGTCPIGSVMAVAADGSVACIELPHDDVFRVANIAARDALVVGTGDDEVSDGDIVEVADDNGQTTKYVYDGTAGTWLKFNGGKNAIRTGETTLTTFTPVHMDGGGFVASQGTAALSAEFLMVGTGLATENDICDFVGHGFTVGEYYVTDPNNQGAVVPLSSIPAGEPYQLLFKVPNADQIAIDVQPLKVPGLEIERDHQTSVGGETTSTINHIITSSTRVYRDNGRLQVPGVDYTFTGNVLTWLVPTVAGEQIAAITFSGQSGQERQVFTPTPGDTAFTWQGTLPANADLIEFYRDNGRLQDPADYTITGNMITTSPTVAGEVVQIIVIN